MPNSRYTAAWVGLMLAFAHGTASTPCQPVSINMRAAAAGTPACNNTCIEAAAAGGNWEGAASCRPNSSFHQIRGWGFSPLICRASASGGEYPNSRQCTISFGVIPACSRSATS